MEKIEITKELKENFDRLEKENIIAKIINSNDALGDALSAMYYFNKFENDLSEIGIDIINGTDFQTGINWLAELIKSELIYEFNDIPKEFFETDDYLNIIYGTHLTDEALIVSLSHYINWIRENN